ncbi:unnamed protein product [Penicillium salamii]|nr:unnamed protein product [Penicillium salamii]CAG8350957.1 unnamed protein product [Penicillium salamii]CAG8608527.1 unnamed protein product [Penicillium salamii]
MSPMKLSKAINILRAARGNLSLPQFDQLMHEHDDDESIPSVRLSSLKVSEVARVLCLSPAKNDQGWDSAPTVPLPELLVKSLALVDDSLSCETSAEASVRWRMNYFLLCALDIATASGSKEEQLPKIDLEPKWSFGPVQYNDQAVKLTGYPYYALWYGEKDEAASNVIVTQGQGLGGSEEAIAEVLGYMGFIHHHRKNAKKEIFPLYGIATDARIFHFVKLDNDSTVCLFNSSRLIERAPSNTL